MLRLSRTTAGTHEDLFIQRYQALAAWALRLCGNDRQHAEDLVQDAFVAFTLSRPDLAEVENLDGYLRGMLRKLHVSRIRRAAQGAQATLALLDQDSAELGLRAVGAATVEATQELACVCRYACLRKASSKAGSILILRFFHGYFPSEIAQIARCTPHVVDDWLRIARREARLFREEPHRLRFLRSPQPSVPVSALDTVRTGEPAECLLALRTAIFQAHEGRCWTRRELADAYTEGRGSLEASRLAHVVSCRRCLERINALLGLGSLDDRSPHDMLGPSGGAGGPRRAPTRAAGTPSMSASRERLWRTAYEHRASELRIVVNGFTVGTHTVGRALTRQSVAVTLDEPIGSVEVFGERGVRLAFLDVQPLPEGLVDQSVDTHLSEDRRLHVRVSFARPFPEVHVEYEDPHWSPGGAVAEDVDLDTLPREPHRASRLASRLTPWLTPWLAPWPTPKPAGTRTGLFVRPRLRFALAVLCLTLYTLFAPAGTTAWAAERIRETVISVARELIALPGRLWTRPPLASRPVAGPMAGLPPLSVARRPMMPALPARADATATALGAERQTRVAIDVLARLDAAGALLGGQIDVELAPRAVIVRGLIEDEARRRELLRALGPLQRDRLVRVDVVTVAERARQQRAAAPHVQYRPIEFAAGGIPVAGELRAYLTRYPEWTNAEASVVEAEVRRIATAGLRRSRTALLHAVLLRSLAERYDASTLRALDEQAYETWRTLLATHASAFADEAGGVRALIRPAFLEGDERAPSGETDGRVDVGVGVDVGAGVGVDKNDGGVALNEAAARIGDLAIAIDEAVRTALSASTERPGRLRVKDATFWQTVRTAERLARTLGR
jgi:DNA-directed RNA polymerase specialized sigma24 family protein